jgi:DUF971 family protein
MGLWDHVKPTPRTATPVAVHRASDGSGLKITWDDGQETTSAARVLRQTCPCAGCVDEWTRKRTFDPATVPMDVKITDVLTVGNYALTPIFSDGHQTGIFRWETLREAGQPTSRS